MIKQFSALLALAAMISSASAYEVASLPGAKEERITAGLLCRSERDMINFVAMRISNPQIPVAAYNQYIPRKKGGGYCGSAMMGSSKLMGVVASTSDGNTFHLDLLESVVMVVEGKTVRIKLFGDENYKVWFFYPEPR